MNRYIQVVIICIAYALYGKAQEEFSLTKAVQFALQNHPSMQVSRLEGVNSEWQYKEALSIGLPRINGNVDYSYYYQAPVVPTEDFITPIITEAVTGMPYTGPTEYFELGFFRRNNLSLGLNGEVLVFDGNFLKGLKAAKMFIDLAKKQVEKTEQDIIQNVVRAYQSVLIAERNINIIDNNIANVSNLLNETQAFYNNGFVEELDVDRLKLSLENLITEREKLNQLIEVSYNVLKYQMAYPVASPIIVTEKLEDVINLMLIEKEGAQPDIDYTIRPEHRLLVDAIALDYADLERIRQGYLPTVTASVGYTQSLQRDQLFNGEELGFIPNGLIGLKARIPIYDGGNTKAKLEQKKIEIEKREIELSEFDRAMQLQVYNAAAQYDNAKKTLDSAKRTLALNEKIFEKTQIKYKEGVGSSLEVSQAESSLYQAQASYINALYDVLSTRTELDIATGEINKTK